jgi:teichuronic acid biosynthesis glycosyltransferase TuaC
MRILLITHLYPTIKNKIFGVFTARQFEALSVIGVDITVFFTIVWVPHIIERINTGFFAYHENHTPLNYAGLKVITVPFLRWTRSMAGSRWDGICIYHAAKKHALKLHREKPFDIVYGKGIFPSADAAVRLARLLNIPAVGEGIGSDVNVVPDYSSSLHKHFLRTTQGLSGAVADGKGVAERLSNAMRKEVPTIHGLVDTDKFQPVCDKAPLRLKFNIKQSALVLLFVGSLKKEKGVYELIEVFFRILNHVPNAVLHICGVGVEHTGLEKIISGRNLSQYVFLNGAIDPEKMHTWMQASDVFVFPTYYEGMPNVVMEAMACGLPVVATAVGGLPDALENCEGAVLVAPKDIKELTAAVLKICKDKALRENMGVHARETAIRKFGLQKNTLKLLNYLKATVAQYKQRPL